jgi:hypothetical protein
MAPASLDAGRSPRMPDVGPANDVAEVDGNRTRRRGIATTTRFEGGGAHQVLVHLHPAG